MRRKSREERRGTLEKNVQEYGLEIKRVGVYAPEDKVIKYQVLASATEDAKRAVGTPHEDDALRIATSAEAVFLKASWRAGLGVHVGGKKGGAAARERKYDMQAVLNYARSQIPHGAPPWPRGEKANLIRRVVKKFSPDIGEAAAKKLLQRNGII